MVALLHSLVVSQMEYCCVIWSPTESYHIKLLESVQQMFTRQIAQFDAKQLQQILMEAVASIKAKGATVISLISDNCGTNRGVYRLMGGSGQVCAPQRIFVRVIFKDMCVCLLQRSYLRFTELVYR